AKTLRSLTGLPGALSLPTTDRQGRLMLFAADEHVAPIIQPKTEDQGPQRAGLGISYPALLIYEGNEKTPLMTIARDDILAYAGFPTYGMRLREFIAHPRDEAWVSYDGGSGELLWLRLKPKSGS